MAGVRQFEENEVLARAEAVFRRKGFEATSMCDLAQATGVQRGSLYNAYGDKEALFLRAFDAYEARIVDSVASALAGAPGAAGLERLFETLISNMTLNEAARGCLTTRLAAEGDLASPKVAARVRDLLSRLETAIRAALERPEARAGLALPPMEAARLIVTFTRGLAVMERVHGDATRLRATARDLARLLYPAG